ncbi:MAG: ABC transporter ATP-binding protein [Patescibacteria group bacterium UBA2163]
MDKKTEHIPQHPLLFVWFATKPHKWWFFGALLAVTIANGIGSSIPYVFGRIVDVATQTSSMETLNLTGVWYWGVMYIGALAVMYVAYRTSGFLGMQFITRMQATGYHSLFAYLTKHSHTFFSNRFAGALTNKVANAAFGAGNFAESFLWNYYTTVITFLVTGALIFSASVTVGFVFLALLVVLFSMNYVLVQRRRPLVVAHAKENSVLRGIAVDIASNINAVQQFARRKHELDFLGVQVTKERLADVKQWRMSEWVLTLNNVLIVIAAAVMLFVLVRLLAAQSITLGQFVMVLTLMFEVVGVLTFIGSLMNGFIRRYGEIEEGLDEVLKPHGITNYPKAGDLAVGDGVLSFNDVGFSYGTHDVFKNLNLTIKSGERVGVVGASGAGKTTLVSLVLRQHDVHEGMVEIDGQNIRKVTLDSLRSAIAVVPQEPALFHRTLKENIAYGNPNATDEEIVEAAKQAQAHAFIQELPEGYDTLVGERGIKLSGGQRQRIAIARALLKNAPFLVLDEATSALDSESEVEIQKAFHTLMEGKTVIAIAHRLSTLREMDRIIVFEEGKIVQDGTHEELLKEEGGVYARLWNHQAGGFLQDD